MNVVVTLEHRFEQTPDGAVWTQTQYPCGFWRPYLEVFDTVRVIARVRQADSVPENWKRADGNRVVFAPVPYYVGPWQYLLKRRGVIRAVRAGLGSEDAVILRVPSQIARCLDPVLRRTHHPYAVEVVADPYDVFAPGSVKHPLSPFFRWWSPRELRRVCRNAMAASYVTRAALQRRYPCPNESVGCSDVEILEESLVAAPRQQRRDARRFRLIFVGTLAQLYKAPNILIEATALCIHQGLDVELVLVGDGKHRQELEEQARRLKVGDRIHFRGQLTAGDAVRAELDRADLFVLPSFQEGLPRAMVEAMARALPCIGSTVGGIPELLASEDLVPPGNPQILALRIREVLSDPARQARMSARNLATAQEYRQEVLHGRRVAFYQTVKDKTAEWLRRKVSMAFSPPPLAEDKAGGRKPQHGNGQMVNGKWQTAPGDLTISPPQHFATHRAPSILMVVTVPVTFDFLAPHAKYFRAKGWRVDGLANMPSDNGQGTDSALVARWRESFDRLWDIQWSRNPLKPGNMLMAPREVRELVLREGYDLVHVHTPVAAFVTRLALRKLRKTGKPRVIYTAHGFHFYQGGPRLKGAFFRRLEKWAGAWTDYLVVINREDEQAALRYGIVPRERLRYMPGIGVDMQFYNSRTISETDLAQVRRELRLGPHDRLFLMVAELIPRKRPFDLLHAFARLRQPHVYLAFAGAGPLLEDLKRLAEKLGVAEQVRFLGHRQDIPVLIQSSVAMILPSQQEGLPRSIMESLCQGIPVIASRIRGVTDLLENERGLLVPVGDVEGFAQAMGWVLDHPEESKKMARRGQQAMGVYRLEHIQELHEQLYAEALQPESGFRVVAPAMVH